MPLDEVVRESAKNPADRAIFNNAAQAWNHAFFWACLSPRGGQPSGELKQALERDFGSVDNFREQFAKEGVAQFGSGWVWLVADGGKLKIEKTANAETPMANGRRCILTIDVWEHAYYLDYQNRRPDFLKAVSRKAAQLGFRGAELPARGLTLHKRTSCSAASARDRRRRVAGACRGMA